MMEMLGQGRGFVDYGPMQMTIQAAAPGQDANRLVQTAGDYAMSLLKQVARYKMLAARPQSELPAVVTAPPVLRRMVEAVRQSGDRTLTPMAAVAGAIADLTADYLVQQGAVKVIANNGGDIAIRLQAGQSVLVGVAASRNSMAGPTLLVTGESGIGGIATSGLGGRSFSKGIATAAVAAAGSAALADACATSIGNAVYTPHASIRLALAEDLDPNTDIRGHYVVKEAGLLPAGIIQQALANGRIKAAQLLSDQIICGAAVFIDDWSTFVPEDWLLVNQRLSI
ncbi:UPF0280 family protein|uniref:FAD:protein FMN transferase n=1 Tax=Dendrosporobacter quercicolus TaxID=146817 RepID=A0A1G9QKG9_9FIRM|nr:hypothetical protein [Dendrosporobacter quercicolus]NSL48255.1 UPF0280 family protein [Dendrosporobacter quercicolus DSM 1736]SDM10765.1 hypothetical protein SAMN04488502_102186 [Dendrosporobacter quercicolus]